MFTTANDSNFNAGEPFPPARHLRGRGTTRRCLACGSSWTPLDPTGKPDPCCLATSRTAVALDDEVPVGRVVQDARASAAVAHGGGAVPTPSARSSTATASYSTMSQHGVLRGHFDDLDDAVEAVTGEAGSPAGQAAVAVPAGSPGL